MHWLRLFDIRSHQDPTKSTEYRGRIRVHFHSIVSTSSVQITCTIYSILRNGHAGLTKAHSHTLGISQWPLQRKSTEQFLRKTQRSERIKRNRTCLSPLLHFLRLRQTLEFFVVSFLLMIDSRQKHRVSSRLHQSIKILRQQKSNKRKQRFNGSCFSLLNKPWAFPWHRTTTCEERSPQNDAQLSLISGS